MLTVPSQDLCTLRKYTGQRLARSVLFLLRNACAHTSFIFVFAFAFDVFSIDFNSAGVDLVDDLRVDAPSLCLFVDLPPPPSRPPLWSLPAKEG